MNTEKLIRVCEQVALDAENDAREFDGKLFNGRNVAEYFGNHGAAITALANTIKEILQNNQNGTSTTTTEHSS